MTAVRCRTIEITLAFAVVFLSTFAVAQKSGLKPPPDFKWDAKSVVYLSATLESEVQISAGDKRLLESELRRLYGDDPNAAEHVEKTRVEPVDLNHDGVAEIVAQASGDRLCSPTGNCEFWIFQRSTAGFRVILHRAAVQNFMVRPTRTHGYNDLVLGMHGSATEQGLYVYRFEWNAYQKVACYDASWSVVDKQGQVHNVKHPLLTACRP